MAIIWTQSLEQEELLLSPVGVAVSREEWGVSSQAVLLACQLTCRCGRGDHREGKPRVCPSC